jgi:hypothetical protein
LEATKKKVCEGGKAVRKLLVVLAAFALVVVYTVPGTPAQEGFYENGATGTTLRAGDMGGRSAYDTGLTLRRLYDAWRFGTGTLLAVHGYMPMDTVPSDMVWNTDDDPNSCGLAYSGRLEELKVAGGGLEVGLIGNGRTSSVPTATETDYSIARLEASYSFSVGPVTIKPFLGYNPHDDLVSISPAEKSYSIDCSLFGGMAQFPVGAFTISLGVYSTRNFRNYGLAEDATSFPGADARYTVANAFHGSASDSVEDIRSTGSALAVNYKASDTITVQGGFGMISNEVDVASGVRAEFEVTAVYIQAMFTLAKNVYITPEIGAVDYSDLRMSGTADTKLGDVSYYGAKWEIRF